MTSQMIRLPGLDDDDERALNHLVEQLDRHQGTNRLLDAYYDAERNMRKMFGGVVPQQYYRLGLALGWSSKGVDALGRRCNLERMVWADGDLDSSGFREVWDGNRVESEVDQAITDTLVHGLSFGVASKGGEGEPGGLLHFYSAVDATGDRNPVTRRLDNLLIARERGEQNRITALSLLLPGRTIAAAIDGGRWKILDESEHKFGVPAAPLVYRPRLRRPMGRSRLTRPVRGLQDAGVRALVRLEGHMDIYAYPEFWMLGADPSIFKNPDGTAMAEWMQRLGRIKGIPDDQDLLKEENPLARADVKKFDAASPAPHLSALNVYAKAFARELSLPDWSVALTDVANPTSAEAYDAGQHELIAEAEGTIRELTPALRRLVPIAMAMQSNMDTVPTQWSSIDAQWRDPRYQSRAAQADAGSKALAAVPELAQTEVGLELLGLTPQQIERFQSERRRARGTATIDALLAAARQGGTGGLAG
ncbi:hypothetical protein CHO01_25290 [Cellulomonas hominis]|uniref:Phage portal protein n=1 Tax=Cellulomonas hominis TaxID=156981 RepID=A0A511FDY1_9CELL|nr:phage portal protein [Cellulomonas hominis]MBB5472495.1 hypothetical protein [Cellulomonas hominis]GEL47413.1 hypothetical protein CHO01_25290 [Cellulomonas hominis]